jgi:tetratricopeptide (TPR) repeat protein
MRRLSCDPPRRWLESPGRFKDEDAMDTTLRWRDRALCLWPGLAELWQRGSWSGLALAIGFSLLLNLTLAATWLWADLMPHSARSVLWGVVVVIWAISALFAIATKAIRPPARADVAATDPYLRARSHYLQGRFFEADRELRQILRRQPKDAESRLLLATLLRREGRADDARAELDRLERLEVGAAWSYELGRERELLSPPAAAYDGTEHPVESPERLRSAA